ncbi:hypothetical protein QEN19_000275 [Hanseniaspora menglaensis]
MVAKVERELYQKLASDFEDERMQTTIAIITALNKIQEEDVSTFEGEIAYSIQRLMKSLSTNKRFSRLGYSVCLGEVLNLHLIHMKKSGMKIEDFTNELYINLAKELPLNNNDNKKDQNKKVKGKEERGDAFGRLFGLQILSNPPLFDNVFFEKNGQKVNLKVAKNYIKQLYQLSNYKSWISETSLFAVFEFIVKILAGESLTEKYRAKFKVFVVELLEELDLTMTLEGLAIYLRLIYSHGDIKENIELLQSVSLGKLHWENNDPLAKANLNYLIKVLKGMEVSKTENNDESFETKNKGFWTPRLHFSYNILIEQLVAQDNNKQLEISSKKLKKNNGLSENNSRFTLKDFAVKVVDETFFAEKSSTERKYVGFEIIKMLIETDSSMVKNIFSLENFKRVFINQISNKDRLLHKQAKSCMEVALKYFENNPQNVGDVLMSLWELKDSEGYLNFDNLTKTKICHDLLSLKNIPFEQKLFLSKSLVDICETIALNLTEESLKKYKFCIDQLLNFLKNQKDTINTGNSENWAIYVIHKLCDLSFFKTKTELSLSQEDFQFDDEDDNNIHVIATERLYSIIGELLGNDNLDVLNSVLQYVIKNESDDKLLFKLDPELLNIKLESISALVELKALQPDFSEPKISLLKSVKVLIQTILLQVFSGNSDAIQILDDLLIFYQSCIINEEEKSWIGITEIYLVLLSQSKSFLKKIVVYSFTHLVQTLAEKDMNFLRATVSPFVDVLKARENKSGFEKLFQGDEFLDFEDDETSKKSTEDASENEDNDESDSDIDMDDMSEVEFDGLSEESDDEVSKIEKQTTSALVKALQLPENIVDENGNVNHDLSLASSEESKSDSEEEEEELLDDEKMMLLDSTLSNIFKHRKDALTSINTGNKRKIDVQNARETVVTLKNRVVDLIEQFIKSQETILNSSDSSSEKTVYALEGILVFLTPLVECIRTTTNKALSDKISKVIKTKVMKLKVHLYPISKEFVNSASASLSTLHKLALTEKPGLYSKLFYNILSTCSLFHCKLIWNSSDKIDNFNFSKINGFYDQVMCSWISNSDIKLSQAFFTDFINWANSKRQPQKDIN